jgi:hypothetical protein
MEVIPIRHPIPFPLHPLVIPMSFSHAIVLVGCLWIWQSLAVHADGPDKIVRTYENARTDWSGRYPPPVKVAPLLRSDIRQASHQDYAAPTGDSSLHDNTVPTIPDVGVATLNSDHHLFQRESIPSWRPPTHRTIEAPSMKKTAPRASSSFGQAPVEMGRPGQTPGSWTHVPLTQGTASQEGIGSQEAISPTSRGTTAHRTTTRGMTTNGNGSLSSSRRYVAHGPLVPSMPGVENDPSSGCPGHTKAATGC